MQTNDLLRNNDGTQTAGADLETAPETEPMTRTMLVKFLGTDRKGSRGNTVTYVRRAVGVSGVARHFALTIKMKPAFWRKVLKAGPLPPGTMILLTLEQRILDDRVCTYATNFSLAPEAAPSAVAAAG